MPGIKTLDQQLVITAYELAAVAAKANGSALGKTEGGCLMARSPGRMFDPADPATAEVIAMADHSRSTGTVVRDGREVEVPVTVIPSHNRPDGYWCRWTGARTAEPHGWCPDRCQAPGEERLCGGRRARNGRPGKTGACPGTPR